MGVNENNKGATITPGSPLARVLDGYAAPELPAGFADRVLAAAEARGPQTAAPLPQLRRPAASAARGWRMGRRIALGVASFSVLATAAAATGLLQQLAIPVPSARTMWASIAGPAAAETTPRAAAAASLPDATPTAPASPVAIEGPIDTPEELGEAFRRAEQVRTGRREERRAILDQRIRNEIARRRAAGLPVPTPEQEARLRARWEAEITRREQLADQKMQARRADLERKVESGEGLTRDDFASRAPVDPALREQVRTLRQLPPEERRAAWRNLAPEQRRAIMEQVRARRAGQQAPADAASSQPAPAPAPETPPAQ